MASSSASASSSFPDGGSASEIKRYSDNFLRRYAVARQSGGKKMKMTQFSHSNFKGASDHITESGKLAIPEDPNTRDIFADMYTISFLSK